jgi:hypothetical protein
VAYIQIDALIIPVFAATATVHETYHSPLAPSVPGSNGGIQRLLLVGHLPALHHEDALLCLDHLRVLRLVHDQLRRQHFLEFSLRRGVLPVVEHGDALLVQGLDLLLDGGIGHYNGMGIE